MGERGCPVPRGLLSAAGCPPAPSPHASPACASHRPRLRLESHARKSVPKGLAMALSLAGLAAFLMHAPGEEGPPRQLCPRAAPTHRAANVCLPAPGPPRPWRWNGAEGLLGGTPCLCLHGSESLEGRQHAPTAFEGSHTASSGWSPAHSPGLLVKTASASPAWKRKTTMMLGEQPPRTAVRAPSQRAPAKPCVPATRVGCSRLGTHDCTSRQISDRTGGQGILSQALG